MVLPSSELQLGSMHMQNHRGSGGGVGRGSVDGSQGPINNAPLSGDGGGMEEVLGFLKIYKPLECECCEEIVAYVERKTGRLLCNPMCGPKDKPATMQKMTIRNNFALAHNGRSYDDGNLAGTSTSLYETLMARSSKLELQHGLGNEGHSGNGSGKFTVGGGLAQRSDSKSGMTGGEGRGATRPDRNFEGIDLSLRTPARMAQVVDEEGMGNVAPLKPAENMRKEGNPFLKAISPKNSLAGSVKSLSSQQQPPMIPAFPAQSAKKPAAVELPNMWTKMKYSENIKSGATAKIAHSYSLSRYQVTVLDDEDMLDDIQDLVTKYIEKNPDKTYAKMNRVPIKNEIVLGRYQEEDYFRGRVLEVGETDCEILFLDYGDTERIKYDVLYEPDEAIVQIPISGITIALRGVPFDAYLDVGSQRMQYVNKKIADLVILQLHEKIETRDNEVFEATLRYDDNNSFNDIVQKALK